MDPSIHPPTHPPLSIQKQDGKLVKVFTNVESKVKRHSEEVLEALKALQS